MIDLRIIARTLMGKPVKVINDRSFPGEAAINLETYDIIYNPDMVAESLRNAQAYINSVNWKPYDYRELNSLFLFLHEIGHFKYSPTMLELKAAIAKNPDIPEEFQMFCSNAVEDSIIQRMFEKEYPSKIFTAAWRLCTPIHQGAVGAQEFLNNINAGTAVLNVHNQIYYLILYAYNRHNPTIQNLYKEPYMIWSEGTMEKFQIAFTTYNRVERLNASVEFIKSAWNDIKNSGQDLMQQIKVMMNAAGSGGEDQQGQSGQGQGGKGEGQDQSQGQPQDGQGGQGGQVKDLPQELKDAIKKACEEFNKQINAGKEKQDKQEEQEQKAQASKDLPQVDERVLDDLDNDMSSYIKLGGKPGNCGEDGSQQADMNQGKLNQLGSDLYKKVVPIFARIHNEEPYWKNGLEEGEEIDEYALADHYLSGDMRIFKDYIATKENRKINITYFLDDSGSMGGSLYTNCANILSALCHAFEEADITTQIYLFSNSCVKIKDKTERAVWFQNDISNILATCKHAYRGGGTSIKDGLKHYLKQDIIDPEETINIVYILTDGELWDHGEAAELVQKIRARQGYVFGIGLNLGQSSMNNFGHWMGGQGVKNYSQTSIIHELGPDIVRTIDKIVHKQEI